MDFSNVPNVWRMCQPGGQRAIKYVTGITMDQFYATAPDESNKKEQGRNQTTEPSPPERELPRAMQDSQLMLNHLHVDFTQPIDERPLFGYNDHRFKSFSIQPCN
jgi:hypothetical protein